MVVAHRKISVFSSFVKGNNKQLFFKKPHKRVVTKEMNDALYPRNSFFKLQTYNTSSN